MRISPIAELFLERNSDDERGTTVCRKVGEKETTGVKVGAVTKRIKERKEKDGQEVGRG